MEAQGWDIFASSTASGSLWAGYQLARSLAQREQSVRLFTDHVGDLAVALADVDSTLWVQHHQGMELCDARFAAVCAPSHRLVQVFGARVPAEYMSRFAGQGSGRQWVQLDRVDSARPSASALNIAESTSGFTRYHARIGDLPHAAGYAKSTLAPIAMRKLRSGPKARAALFGAYGLPETLAASGAMAVYLAAYPSTRIGPWLKQFQTNDRPVCVFVQDGDLQERVARMAGRPTSKDPTLRFDSLTLIFLTPMRWFLEDELIWTADLVITDQADKAARAAAAGTPLIWGGSDPGSTAFVDWYMPEAPLLIRDAARTAFDALATAEGVPLAWQAFHGPHWPDMVSLAQIAARRIERGPELGSVMLARLSDTDADSVERQFSPTRPSEEEAFS